MPKSFTATLVSKGPNGAWTHLVLPFDAEQAFGSKARIPVAGTLNGMAFRNSIMPVGDGTHYMNINKQLLAATKTKGGDEVHVVMAVDKTERVAEVPEDLQQALGRSQEAGTYFTKLSYSHKKAYTDWINSAKKPETRAARILKAIEMLAVGKKID